MDINNIDLILKLTPQELLNLDERVLGTMFLFYSKETNNKEKRKDVLRLLFETYLLYLNIKKDQDIFKLQIENIIYEVNKAQNILIEVEDYERCVITRDIMIMLRKLNNKLTQLELTKKLIDDDFLIDNL